MYGKKGKDCLQIKHKTILAEQADQQNTIPNIKSNLGIEEKRKDGKEVLIYRTTDKSSYCNVEEQEKGDLNWQFM